MALPPHRQPPFAVLVLLAAGTCLTAPPGEAQSMGPVSVRVFEGAAPGEGLDLTASPGGRFVHAIDFGGASPTSLAGLTFTPDEATPALEFSSSEAVPDWGSLNAFGGSAADQALARILHGMRWAPDEEAVLSFTLRDLDPSSSHHLQLLFSEKCCDRGFDVLVNDALVVPRFSARQVTGNDLGKGAVIGLILEPGIRDVHVTLRGAPAFFPDPHPVIQAATLEELPREGPALADLPRVRLSHSGAAVQLRWDSHPGVRYGVQYSGDLRGATWISVAEDLEGQGQSLTFRDTNPARWAKPTGFYRVTVLSP